AEAEAAAPDAAFLLTADHGVHHKARCWDLEKACRNRGLTLRAALSPERDHYPQHHRGFGGAAWVYLEKRAEADHAASILEGLQGVESVLDRTTTSAKFGLMPDRIGELAVFGDCDTVFGELDTESESLPATY